MNTGEVVTDSQGTSWKVGQPLGRGLWGSSWVVHADDGRELVVKVAHGRADFPEDARLPEGLERACARCAEEQAALLKDANEPFLARLEGRATIGGRPALFMPRYDTSVGKRLVEGAPLSDMLATLGTVAEYVNTLATSARVHGDLRPSNVLLKTSGEPVLTDLLTGTAAEWRRRLEDLTPRRQRRGPAEAGDVPQVAWDTWALCEMAYAAAVWLPGKTGAGSIPAVAPTEGLSKIALTTVRDRAHKRLKAEGANPRFTGKVCERLGSLLNRGLSHAVEPSPPYRFHQPSELAKRLHEVEALVHPAVVSVGKILLPSTAADGVFKGGDAVTFSVTVTLTEGVTGHESIACGLRLADLDSPDRRRVHVEDTAFDVKPHPSGRLRYQFTLKAMPPGRYAVSAAFTMQDSGDEPMTSEGEISLRPPAGYVPPPADASPKGPLSFADRRKSARDPHAQPVDPNDPVAQDVARLTRERSRQPNPIAPTAHGVATEGATAPTAVPSTAPSHTGHEPPPAALARPQPTATVASAPTVPGDRPSLSASEELAPFPAPDPTPWRPPSASTPSATPSTDAPAAEAGAPSTTERPYVPHADDVSDLPSWSADDVTAAPLWQRAFAFARQDTLIAILFVATLILVVLVAIASVLKACNA